MAAAGNLLLDQQLSGVGFGGPELLGPSGFALLSCASGMGNQLLPW